MKKLSIAGILTALLAAGAMLAGGCSGSKIRKVSISDGEYYSEDEYDTLSDRAKRHYCQELQSALAVAQEDFENKADEIADAKHEIDEIRKKIVPLEQEVLSLESDIRTLREQIREIEELPKMWTIKPGESLTLIAMNEKVYNDIDKWWRIFEANQDKIFDPYYIFPDTVLVIPRDWPAD